MQTIFEDSSSRPASSCNRIQPPAAKRVANIERQARFHEIVPPHLSEARVLARSITGSGADSEDVVQEACLRAFRGIAGFGGKNARAWVLTIVRHTAYDWIRKKRMAPELIEDFADLAVQVRCDEGPLTPESHLVSYQDAQQLEETVQSLPELFRQALVLRYTKGLAYKEIAAVMGVPTGTVMSRLSRARRLVRDSSVTRALEGRRMST
jgi:RNA polymerase sigma factor (sigma-70 family)